MDDRATTRTRRKRGPKPSPPLRVWPDVHRWLQVHKLLAGISYRAFAQVFGCPKSFYNCLDDRGIAKCTDYNLKNLARVLVGVLGMPRDRVVVGRVLDEVPRETTMSDLRDLAKLETCQHASAQAWIRRRLLQLENPAAAEPDSAREQLLTILEEVSVR